MELLYHVNENDEVLGRVSREKAHSRGLLHRTGIVFLVNSANMILLNQRSPERMTFPSMYDSSVSFHVIFGETYEEAAERETLEEIHIQASFEYLGKFLHFDPPEYQIVAVFLCHSDDEPIVDRREFASHQFYSINDAQTLLHTQQITPWLRDGWKLLAERLT